MGPPRFVPVVVAGLALLISSCGDSVQPVVPVATTIVVDVNSMSFSTLGEEAQLAVSVYDQSGEPLSGSALDWSSLDESVVVVSGSGRATAVGNGATRIMVGSDGASAQVVVTVEQIATTLTLSVDTVAFGVLGDTVRISTTIEDAGGSVVAGAVVQWETLDSTVTIVSADGLITATGNGGTLVIVSSSSLLGRVEVTVAQTPAAVDVSADSIAFDALTDTVRLSATVRDAGGSLFESAPITWSTSESAVALVSADGLVTSVDNGVATVTATSGSTSFPTVVTVQQTVATVNLQPESVVFADLLDATPLLIGVLDRLGAPVLGQVVTWTSSDEAVATVDATGIATAVGTGTTSISAEAGGVTAIVTARVVPELTLLAATPSSVDAEVASTVALSVRAEDLLGSSYEGATVLWNVDSGGGAMTSSSMTSSDENGYTGAVWALGTGAGIQNASASIATRGATVVVNFVANAFAAPAATAFLLTDTAHLSGRGETAFLAPSFEDVFGNVAQATSVSWESSDPMIASVAGDGLVTAGDTGTVHITASLGSPTDSILFTVEHRGAITITFDDGWLTTYDVAWPILQEFNLVGNVGVYTAAIDGGFTDYMNETQLQALHDDGWTLVSHSVTHPNLPTLSDGELDYELRTSKQWLLDRGYTRGSNIFIAPYHDFLDRERIATAGYYQASRGTSANIVMPDSMVFWQPSNPYELTGIDVEQLPYTTTDGRAYLQTLLQRAMDEGRFIDVLFHQVEVADQAAFRATLTIIDQFRDRVLPYHLLYPEFARAIF